jgi:Abnormal spindle-like microcephaly-assoc'd, ASPM-SPD-2-Hydin/Beta-propeller repeat
MGAKLQRSALALGLYCSILLLVLDCCGQTLLTPVAKGANPQIGARLIERLARSSSLPLKPPLAASTGLLQGHIFFERNDGQTDSQVLYLSHGSGYSLFLTRTGATIVLPELRKKGSGAATRPARYFRLRFEGANPQTGVTGIEALPGTSNYFFGSDPKLWHTRVPQFAKVRYSNLYPGIDLIFYFRDGQLEYDVIASPGADPSAISLQTEGANTSLTRDGDVAIKMGTKEVVRLRKPYAFQSGEAATVVPASYAFHHGELSFVLGDYDRRRQLVIDPALIFATYVTSNCSACTDSIYDIAADNTGVYLTGVTSATNFPATANGPTPGNTQEGPRTFIVKLDPTGSQVLYSALLGDSQGQAIAVDALGSAYVSGSTFPTAGGVSTFPLTSGVFSSTVPSNATGFAAFAAKLSPDGSTILYSTLLQQPSPNPAGSPHLDRPSKIAVDSTGALYIGGVETVDSTRPNGVSTWMSVPVTLGAFQTTPGSAFVLKLNPNASGLDYATYIDGNGGTNVVAGIAVDSSGDAFVAGSTSGNAFPTTTGAYQASSPTDPAYSTGFVMELNPGGTAPVYSTFFGTAGQTNTLTSGLAVDSHGQAVITGFSGGTLPVSPNAFCGNPTNDVGFVVKFTADGSGLVYATTLCDSFSQGAAVAVDSAGAAVAVGVSGTPTAFQSSLLEPIQGYVPSPPGPANIAVKLDTSGNRVWSTFFGNNSSGIVEPGVPFPRVVIDGNGAAYILDTSTILPTPNSVGPPFLNPGAGGGDVETFNFLLKIAPSLGAPVPIVSPRQLSFVNQNVGTASTAADVQVGNFGDAPMSPGVSITGDFSETDNCSVAVPGGQKCDINVVFTPTVMGARTGTLTVSFGGTIPSQTIQLTGNAGAPAASLSPTSLSFGDQANGTTSPAQQVTVTNSGTGPLTLSSIQTTSEFAATNTCGAPVAPSGSCTIQVTFTPSASGTQTGTLTIADNAPDSPQTVALTGNVASPGTPGIGLGVPPGGSPSATVTAGATATYALSIGGSGMSGTASLTCTGAPTGAVCSVPASVPLSAASASTFNASITTTARSQAAVYPHGGSAPWLWALIIFGGVSLVTVASARPHPLSRLRVAPLALLGIVLCSCGGSSPTAPAPPTHSSGTPAGIYTIVITAKSGTTAQTQNLTLTVQ